MSGSAFFDAALATSPTALVPVARVLDLLPLSHAPERVEEYRRAMASGARFPPISVLRIGSTWVIADGHKRFAACSGLGAGTIVVEVWGAHRFLADQWRQARANARKNATILSACARDPRQAGRLAATTWRHWRRVAACLWHLARGRVAPQPDAS
jgi:hypothetical protein